MIKELAADDPLRCGEKEDNKKVSGTIAIVVGEVFKPHQPPIVGFTADVGCAI